MESIEICFLNDCESVESELREMGIPKAQIKKYLSNSETRKRVKSKEKLHLPIDLLNRGLLSPIYDGEQIPVLFEDAQFMIVEKPSGIHTVSQRYSDTNSISSWLRAKGHASCLSVNKRELNRGILNRLDKDTSGVVFIAKDNEIYKDIRSTFSEQFSKKRYLCIVHGEVTSEGELVQSLKPYGVKGSRVQVTPDGIECKLSYKQIESDGKYSLVEVILDTGFRHQIRVQLASLGHPIVGDDLYGQDEDIELMLHAYQYELNYHENKYEGKTKYPKRFLKFFNFNSEL